MFLIALALVCLSIYRQISSDELEWTLIKSGYYPIAAAPEDATLGSLILLKRDGSIETLNPTSMCGVPEAALAEDDGVFVVKSPLPNISKAPRFLDQVSESLNIEAGQLDSYPGELVVDRALETAAYVDFLDNKFECFSALIDGENDDCFLFYASEISVAGRPVAFTTSLSCQLFNYENLTAEQVDYLTRKKQVSKHFGITIFQRLSLLIDDLL
ncbi:hypothetical protein [uncultured Tateyamaria sp.]|uniref:hypothetical protein n=1 Tax=uncultured Tateyamaria sp. TaxID=455651 RepID=UPI00262E29AE|nr:hypothetical protein [uncultured Tateyamaria sp.]